MAGHEAQLLTQEYGNSEREIAFNKAEVLRKCNEIALKESDFLIASNGDSPYYEEGDIIFRDDIRFEYKFEAIEWLESIWDRDHSSYLNNACLYKEYDRDGSYSWFWMVGYEYHV